MFSPTDSAEGPQIKDRVTEDFGGVPDNYKNRTSFRETIQVIIQEHCPQENKYSKKPVFQKMGYGRFRLISASKPEAEDQRLKDLAQPGAGFGDAAENKIVESKAVDAVIMDYEGKGWSVRSVEPDKCGFDLICTKNDVIENVEVKGIKGSTPCFIITAGEVGQAETNPRFFLVVVTAALSSSPKLTKYSGAEFMHRFKLSAVQYRATLKP